MSQEVGAGAGCGKNYTSLCKDEAQNVLDKLRNKVRKYFEQVCLAYLDDPTVLKSFESKATGLQKAFRRDNLSKEDEQKYISGLQSKFNPMIDNFLSTQVISTKNLQSLNTTIVSHFTQSDLYKYYDKANWVEHLKEKVRKIYE